MRIRDRYKPAVSNTVRLFLAGFVWVCVGVMLLTMAVLWLVSDPHASHYALAGAGVALGLLVHRFMFQRIVDKNLDRILPVEGKKCLFSFVSWKSYLMVAGMMAMGAVLRHSAIPKHYLAVAYLAMGLALVLSGVRYVNVFLRESKGS